MAVHLVRHAVAVGRSGWSGDDFARPLTPRGRRQAQALIRFFGGNDVRRIRTSPAVRCRDTVAPLGVEHGIELVDDDRLAEGGDDADVLTLIQKLAAKKGDSVLCTHGDIIPDVLRRLARAGVPIESDLLIAKGSTWELVTDGDDIVAARYHPPAE
jgi:broad specificity phosphatase PhoE